MRKSYPVCQDGKTEKTQQCEELVPFRGIAEGIGLFVFSLAAVSVVAFGPAWVVVPVIVAYAATVG